jgi:hypothetical protein
MAIFLRFPSVHFAHLALVAPARQSRNLKSKRIFHHEGREEHSATTPQPTNTEENDSRKAAKAQRKTFRTWRSWRLGEKIISLFLSMAKSARA